MLRYPTYMAVETLTIALVTEDGQSFEDLGIEERKEGQVIIKCRKAEPMGDGAPCEWNKMGSDGYPFCASSTEVMRLLEQNAELRELVRIAGTYCVNGYCGKDDGCPLYLGKPYCALNDRMRELEIEVEG